MTNVIMFVDKGQTTFCEKRDKHKKGLKIKQTITAVSLPTQNHLGSPSAVPLVTHFTLLPSGILGSCLGK